MRFWLTRDTRYESYDFWCGTEPPVKQDHRGITGITYHEDTDGKCRCVESLSPIPAIPLQPGECCEVDIVPVKH